MLRKLYSLVSSSCCADNPDSLQHQEVLLPGTLYGMILKERMEEILNMIRNTINQEVRGGATVDFQDRTSDSLAQGTAYFMGSFRALVHESIVPHQL